MADTTALRTEMRTRRRTIDGGEQRRAASAVAGHVKAASWLRPGAKVGVYVAFDGEVDLTETIELLWSRGAIVAVPDLESAPSHIAGSPAADSDAGASSPMRFAPITADTVWRHNRFGIAEPVRGADDELLDGTDLDVALVPAVAVDRAGNRIGMGGGFYDRTFAQAPRPLLIAVVHDVQVLDHIEPQPHDVAVDAVMTPTRWIDAHKPH